jgi:CRISPR-associated protein Csx10
VEERQLDDQLVPVEALHVVPGADAWLATPRVTMRFHHQRDRRVGRATEDTGAVFTYEALEEGTVLIGAVAIAGESQGELKSRLERVRAAMTAMRLGRSRRTQYGGSPDIMWLSDEAGEAREVTGWEEALDTSRDVRPGEVLRLLLTSDAIVRDPLTGQVDPRSILTTVSGSLGLAAGDVSAPFLGVRWVSGFNAKWGLALPQVPAVAAGSVVVLAPTRDVPAARLRALEERGLGERRAEGFGACLWLGRAGRNGFSFKGVDGLRGTPSRPDGEAPPLVRKIEARLLATDRQRAVEWLAARLAGSTTKDIPSRAILGRIRQALRHDDWEQRLTELMSRSSGFKPKSRRQLEACRLGGEQEALWLDQWLEGLVSMNDPSGAAERPRERLTEGLCLDRHLITRSADAAAYGEQYRLARRSLAGAVLALLAKRSAGGGDR